MEEYISKNRLIKFLDNLRQPKNQVHPAWLTKGFKYITIDEAIRVVSERPTANVVPKREYDLLQSDCEKLRRYLKESWNKVAELDKLNGDMRDNIDKAIKELERYSTSFEYADRHDLAGAVDYCIGVIQRETEKCVDTSPIK